MINDYFKTLISLTDNLYLVGGSVRDYLLKTNCYDYDFVIKDKTISIGKELANKTNGSFFVLDYERETVRIVWNIEGNLFNFDIAKIIGDSLTNDLELRDITINSIAININNDNFENIINNNDIDAKYYIDPSNGIEDLKNKTVNTFKKTNLSDDPLRMLRVFRFSTKLNFSISKNVLDFIKESHEKIKVIAKERILKELYDMLAFNNSNENFKIMHDTGLFYSIFDNILFNKQNINQDIKNLEILFIDLDNIFTYSNKIKEYLNNIIILNRNYLQCLKFSLIFKQMKYEDSSADNYLRDLEKYLKNFTFSVLEQRFIINTVKYSLDINSLEELSLERVDLYLFFKSRKNELISSLLLLYIFSENKDKIRDILEIYFNDELLSNPPDIINGNQIMDNFNLKPSKMIGNLLEIIKQKQAELVIKNYNEALSFIKEELKI